VSFRYRQDPSGERQYGLIAEEVAEVYPELVVHDNKGEVESVQRRSLLWRPQAGLQTARDLHRIWRSHREGSRSTYCGKGS
jgi:Chaperone of endosialidase